MNDNQVWHYDTIIRILHWILAVLLISLLTIGWYMVSIGDQPESGWYFSLHKLLGVIAAVLILARLSWRLFHEPAPLPATVPLWQVKASQVVHRLLYLFMILMPLTGFTGESFSQDGVAFFGISLVKLEHPNKKLSEQLLYIHGKFAWVLAILISIHILAAFKHFLINKDNAFQRMWF